MRSKHPFDPFVPQGVTMLIIGSIPPPRFCSKHSKLSDADVNFYYGSRDNSFWKMLEEIFDEKLEYTNTESAVEQRKRLLEKIQIGITDIIEECIHKYESAEDKYLENIKHKDLKSLLAQNPQITTLIYTSEFVKSQVNKYLNNAYHSNNPHNNKIKTLKVDGKLYEVRILYSPSPQALINLGENGAAKRREQYKAFLTEDKILPQ